MGLNPYLNYINANPARMTLEEAIAQRARELWQQRGGIEGHELEDWVQAETEITKAMAEAEDPIARADGGTDAINAMMDAAPQDEETSNAVPEPEVDAPHAATELVTSAAEAQLEMSGTAVITEVPAITAEPEAPAPQEEAGTVITLAETMIPRPAFIAIKVGETTYTAEYDAANCDCYKPGDFKRGDLVYIHFEEEDKMHIQCLNGQQLEAKVVRKVRAAAV